MNSLQHLLLKLSEEANEVGQIASKCMQFGLLERHPDSSENNKQRLHAELNDFFAIVEMLNLNFDLGFKPDQKAIAAKMNKVYKYGEYSISLGLVTNAVPYEQWSSFASLAPNAKCIQSGSYWHLFCRNDYEGDWVDFEWRPAHQKNGISVYRGGKCFYTNFIDSFRFYEDEASGSGQCALILNENTECLIVYNIPLDQKSELIEMMTHSPLLKIENLNIEQVVEP